MRMAMSSHLGERDCSVQRRHQKVWRKRHRRRDAGIARPHGKAAVEAARAVDYRGAGTVEFLLDQRVIYYFLEMNHATAGRASCDGTCDRARSRRPADRGRARRKAAACQADVAIRGHAIEVRLYAEDPAAGFLPVTAMSRCGGRRRARACASMPVSTRARRSRPSMIRCSPRSSPMATPAISPAAGSSARSRDRRSGADDECGFPHRCAGAADFVDGSATTAFIAENYPDGYQRADVRPASRLR